MKNINKPIIEFALATIMIENNILKEEIESYNDVLLNPIKCEDFIAEIIIRKTQGLVVNKEIVLNALKFYQNLTDK